MDLVIRGDHSSSAANPLRKPDRSNRCAVFGLIGVLGVLAFVFSSVSPDDDIQQEFAQSSKNRQCAVQNLKSMHSPPSRAAPHDSGPTSGADPPNMPVKPTGVFGAPSISATLGPEQSPPRTSIPAQAVEQGAITRISGLLGR